MRLKKHLPLILLITALLLSISAEYYSIYGIGKLFSGASIQVMIMAGCLGLAKIAIAAILHLYWTVLNNLFRGYLLFSVIVLMLITSAGIYGYLSDAYQQTENKDNLLNNRISIVDNKIKLFSDQKTEYQNELTSINGSIENLRKSLSTDNQVQSIDKNTGKVITNIYSSSKKSVENQLNDAISRRDKLSELAQIRSDSINNLQITKIQIEQSSDVVSELGPLKYLSKLTNVPMNEIVNWFLLLLVFVFDPLALIMMIVGLKLLNHIPVIEQINPIVPIISEPTPIKVKRKYVRKPKPEPIIVPEIVEPPLKKTKKRKIIDNNLTSDIVNHLDKSLNKKKV